MMINNDKDLSEQENQQNLDKIPTPDESSGILVHSFLKIFDPESGEIIAQGRD